MAMAQEPATRAFVLAVAAIVVVVVAAIGAIVFLSTAEDSCAPEARQAAVAREANLVLSGVITIDEATDRGVERMLACGD